MAGKPDFSGLDTKLTASDKAELQTFLEHTSQRSELQTRSHVLTDMCFKKCVPGPIKSGSLDRTEETCLNNCVERFFDISRLTVKHIQQIRG